MGIPLGKPWKNKEKMPEISVPHQAIESNLDPLFYLPPVLQKPIKGLIINRKNDPRLHELYLEEIEKFSPKPRSLRKTFWMGPP